MRKTHNLLKENSSEFSTFHSTSIRIAIVENHKILANGLRRLFNELNILNVVAVYSDLAACRKGLTDICPDVLLLDVFLPDGNGVDFCAEIKGLYPDLKILMLTNSNDLFFAHCSLDNGALGYVLKTAKPKEFIAGIRAVNCGKQFICDDLVVLLNEKKEEKLLYISAREKTMIQLISEGCSDSEIAEKLFLSPETTKGYRKDLLAKFNTKKSVTLIKIAMEQKLIQ